MRPLQFYSAPLSPVLLLLNSIPASRFFMAPPFFSSIFYAILHLCLYQICLFFRPSASCSSFIFFICLCRFGVRFFPFSLPCPAVSPSPFPSSLPVFSTPISPSLLFANHPGPAFFPHRMSFLSAYNVLFLVSLEFFWLSEWQ